jgi:hypothetical protein
MGNLMYCGTFISIRKLSQVFPKAQHANGKSLTAYAIPLLR